MAATLSVGRRQRASAVIISSISASMLCRLVLGMASLPTTMLVQKCAMACARSELTKPPGGEYAQTRKSGSDTRHSANGYRMSNAKITVDCMSNRL
jgi:hypothetical protein